MIPRLPRASARLVLAGSLVASSALGAPCGIPDVDFTFPRSNALRVPANAVLAAHYGAPAEYDDELVTLTASNGADVPVSAAFDEAEGLLRASPLTALIPGSYTVVWPSLRGPATGRGRSKSVDFSVVAAADLAPPTFAGFDGITWDLAREQDECTESVEDRYTFDFELGAVTDDSDVSHLAVLVFETEHPRSGPSSAPKQIGLFPMPDDGVLRLKRSARRAGKSCFAAVTRDLVGFVSAGANEEVCAETIEPPWFEGCSLASGRSTSGGSLVGLLGLGWVVRRRRGSRGRGARSA